MAYLRSLSSDTTSKLNILGHDGNTLGVDSTQVGILEETNKVGFGSLLKGKDSRSLEAQISLEVLCNFTDKALEGKLADKQISGLLITTNLTKSDSSWAVSVGLLHTSSLGGGLAGSLGGKGFAWSFTSSTLSCSLLGSGHFESGMMIRRIPLENYDHNSVCSCELD